MPKPKTPIPLIHDVLNENALPAAKVIADIFGQRSAPDLVTGMDNALSDSLLASDGAPGNGLNNDDPGARALATPKALDAWSTDWADVPPMTTEILHIHGCDCGGCAMPEEADNPEGNADNDTTVSGSSTASAPALLGDMADFLVSGYWSAGGSSVTTRYHNVSDLGIDPNNGTLLFNVSGYSTDADGISADRAFLVREAFKLFGATLGINFQETTSTNTGEVDFFFSDNSSGAYAGSSYYSNGEISYSYINIAQSWSGGTSTYDDYTLQTILHEIGHALGLGHQGDYNGSASYGVDNTFENDSWQASMMSYFSQTENTSINASYELLQTPMSVDWMALDVIYGSQGYGTFNAFTENTVWGFNTTITSAVSDIWANFASFGNRTASTIVDGGGVDTLDLSGYSNNSLINLAPSDSGASAPSVSNIGGRVGNLTIAEGTIIENAIGGAGSETFFGNAADNQLTGNGGNDTFNDSAGSDTYMGGSGTDSVLFGGLFSSYTFDIVGSFLKVINAAVDLVESTIEWLVFSDNTYSWQEVADSVDGPNADPDATADTDTTTEAGTATGNLLTNDTDADGDTLSVAAVNGQSGNVGNTITLASGALLTVNADGSYDYDPNGAFNTLSNGDESSDSFTYTVSDGRGGTDTATVTITIDGISSAPVATSDVLSVSEAAAASGNVLTNDTDGDGDALTVTAVNGQSASVGSTITLSSGALLTLNANGNYDYDPNGAFDTLNAGQSATESFAYTVSDGNGGTDTATVTITINGTSAAPVANADSLRLNEAGQATGNVLSNDTDSDGDVLTVSAVNGQTANVGNTITLSSGALLTLNANGSYDYDPNGAFDTLSTGEEGGDSFTYTVADGQGGFDTATVTVTIDGISSAPVANDDDQSLLESATASGNVLTNDTDGDGDALSVAAVNGQAANVGQQITLSSGAVLTVNANGSYDYDPNGAFDTLNTGESTTDSFTYTVSDGKGGTDTATVTLTVNGDAPAPVDTPVLIDFETDPLGSYGGIEDITASGLSVVSGDDMSGARYAQSNGFTLTATGEDFDLNTVSLEAVSGRVRVRIDAYDDGILVGTTNVNLRSNRSSEVSFGQEFDSIDELVVTANGAFNIDNLSLVTRQVDDPNGNRAPVANADTLLTNEAETVSLNLLGNDTDPDGDTLQLVSVAGDLSGTVTLESGAVVTFSSNGTATYDPNGAFDALYDGQTATDSFVYAIEDGQGGTAQAIASVTIEGSGTAPPPPTSYLIGFEGAAVNGQLVEDDFIFENITTTTQSLGVSSGQQAGQSIGDSITFMRADGFNFDFESAVVTALSGKNLQLQIDAYDDGALIGSQSIRIRDNKESVLNFAGGVLDDVDRVVLTANNGFIIDDLTLFA